MIRIESRRSQSIRPSFLHLRNMKFQACFIASLSVLSASMHSQAGASAPSATMEKTSTPGCAAQGCAAQSCAPLENEGSRGDVLQTEGKQILSLIRHSEEDKKRWQTVLHSDAKDKSELELSIIKAANFSMRLDPLAGTLSFSTPAAQHTFVVAEPAKSNTPCPSYDLRIVEASERHALVRQVCPKAEYRPGKFYMSNEYFLYDVQTGIARSIWLSAGFRADSPFPTANPKPSLKLVTDGYEFHWTGDFPGDSGPSKVAIHNKYLRKRVKGEMELVCADMSNPKRPVTENGTCEGTALRRLAPHRH